VGVDLRAAAVSSLGGGMGRRAGIATVTLALASGQYNSFHLYFNAPQHNGLRDNAVE